MTMEIPNNGNKVACRGAYLMNYWGVIIKVAALAIGLIAGKAGAAPFVGKVVARSAGRAIERRIVAETVKQAAKSGLKREMSSALAGVTAKQCMGAGIGLGTAFGIPVAGYKLTDGQQTLDEAKAQAITKAADAIGDDPESAERALTTLTQTSGSIMDRIRSWCATALPWCCGVLSLVFAIYLSGFVLHGVAYLRRGIASVRDASPTDAQFEVTTVCSQENEG